MGGAILSRALTVGNGASAAGRATARGATGCAENDDRTDGDDDEDDEDDDGADIRPTRPRAHLVLRKGPDHLVQQVKLRRL